MSSQSNESKARRNADDTRIFEGPPVTTIEGHHQLISPQSMPTRTFRGKDRRYCQNCHEMSSHYFPITTDHKPFDQLLLQTQATPTSPSDLAFVPPQLTTFYFEQQFNHRQ